MRYAIGDIHGCHKTFMALLEQIKLSKSDSLYLLGDYVDNGPNSKEVLDTILELMRTGYDVHPIKGNHELMFTFAWRSWPSDSSVSWLNSWGVEFCSSFRIDDPSQIDDQYLDFLLYLPYIEKSEGFVFVHSDLDFSKEDPVNETPESHALWARDVVLTPSRFIPQKVVSGHNIRHISEIEAALETSHIFLDNGCGYRGRGEGYGDLIALNLDKMKLYLQKNLDILDQLDDEEI